MRYKLIRVTTVPLSLEKLLQDQLRFMNTYFDVTAIASDEKDLIKFGKKNELRTYSVDLTRQITPLKDIKAAIKLYKYLKRVRPDIVHTHTPKAGIVGMLSSYFAGVPIRLHTVAGLPLMEASGVKRLVLNFVEKLTYKCATTIYPNSHGLKEIILSNSFTSYNKLKVIGNGSSNGIDTSYFNPELFKDEDNLSFRVSLGIKKTDFVFIFVGRIVSDKGINELVEAFVTLCLAAKNIKLLLVGPFEDKLDPLQIKTKLLINNNDKIITVGYQNDVRPYFAISNSLVFPSYREGFPNVVMQAGSMGLPSIVSDINGCNEIIENGVNGTVIKVKSVSAIYDAMLDMYTDIHLSKENKEMNRNIIRQRYDRKLFWELLLHEYNQLTSKN